MKLHPKYLSGLLAFGVYFFIIGLVFYYFGYHSDEKPKNYVAKNSNAISVSLAGAKSPKKIAKPHKKQKPKQKPKPITSKKKTQTKPKPSKKKAKKIKPKSLFSNVKTSQKQTKKTNKKTNHKKTDISQKTGSKGKSTVKKGKKADKGIENRYLAGVQDKLYGWPAQSNFEGAVVVIGLTIYPDGKFDYEILQPSDNPEYNRTIEQYLKQLHSIGFDPTPTGKTYKFRVDIKAT